MGRRARAFAPMWGNHLRPTKAAPGGVLNTLRNTLSTTRREGRCSLLLAMLAVICVALPIISTKYANFIGNTPVLTSWTDGLPLSATSTEMKDERVAICFAGNMRTFYYSFVHDMLLERAINPLRKSYRTDVFFYVRIDDAPPIHKPAQDNGPLSLAAALKFSPVNLTLVSNGTLDEATEEYLSTLKANGVAFTHVIVPDEMREITNRVQFDADKNMDVVDPPARCATANRIRFPHTLLRAKQCLDIISQYEVSHDFQYDWLYKLRPDTVFLDRIPFPSELNTSIVYTNQANPGASKHSAFMWHDTRNVSKAAGGPLNDQIMIASRSLAPLAFRAIEAIEDCESYHPILSMRPPENTLRLWLMKREVAYLAIPFAWATVYEYSGPTCDKLIYQFVPPSQDWKRALRDCFDYAQSVAEFFPEPPNSVVNASNLEDYSRSSSHMELYHA